MNYYSGRVSGIIHSNQSQSFYILKLVLDDPSLVRQSDRKDGYVVVRGVIPGMPIQDGSWFGFEAKWATHSQYGRQLVISRAPVVKKSWDPDSAEKALASNGVGEATVKQIRRHFGDDEFVQSLSNIEKLLEVESLNQFTAAHVFSRWSVVQAYFRSMNFMSELNLPSNKVNQIWSTFGDDAEKILSSNPWELVKVDGITFQNADEIASKLGLDPNNPNRMRGAMTYACKSQRSFGHMYMTTRQLMSEVHSLTGDSMSLNGFSEALATSHKDGLISVDRLNKATPIAVYDPWSLKLEKDSASMLVGRVTSADFCGDQRGEYIKLLGCVGPKTEGISKSSTNLVEVVETAVDEWGDSNKLVLSLSQRMGVINALSSPVSILTGLPGTGKTTCLIAAVSILKDMGIPYLLCAPTGIAAKNLGSKTGARASTIHRSFKAEGKSNQQRDSTYTGITSSRGDQEVGGSERDEQWGYDQEHPHPAKVVIVDEASMLDQHLIYRLLSCTSTDCRLVIVGDAAQLPSVGPGNVLRDIINTNVFPIVNLTEIFRQKDTSGIVYAAHSIYHGEVPDTEAPDFRLIPLRGDDAVADAIVKIAIKLHGVKANFQVLSPRHSGAVGVTALNNKMREVLNPGGTGAQEINIGDSTIREGDRVMIIKNNYELKVFNGDVGKVSRINRKSKEVEVRVYGDIDQMVAIPFKDASSLIRLAYACTVHKSQGLEYDVIVMPIVESFKHQLQRNLLYTAVTRAKKKVYLIGSAQAVGMAVVNDREDQRNTQFGNRITLASVGSGEPALA